MADGHVGGSFLLSVKLSDEYKLGIYKVWYINTGRHYH